MRWSVSQLDDLLEVKGEHLVMGLGLPLDANGEIDQIEPGMRSLSEGLAV